MLELVDEVDSKSIASDGVRVRVPPPAPFPQSLGYQGVAVFFMSLLCLIFSYFVVILGGTSEGHFSNRSRIDAQDSVC